MGYFIVFLVGVSVGYWLARTHKRDWRLPIDIRRYRGKD